MASWNAAARPLANDADLDPDAHRVPGLVCRQGRIRLALARARHARSPGERPAGLVMGRSMPGSPCNSASSAEASRTGLLTCGLCPALGDEFTGQGTSGTCVAADEVAGARQRLPGCEDPQLSAFNPEYHFVPRSEAEEPPIRGRDDQPSSSSDTCLHLDFVTYDDYCVTSTQ